MAENNIPTVIDSAEALAAKLEAMRQAQRATTLDYDSATEFKALTVKCEQLLGLVEGVGHAHNLRQAGQVIGQALRDLVQIGLRIEVHILGKSTV